MSPKFLQLPYNSTLQNRAKPGTWCNKFPHSASVWFLFSVLTMCFTPLYTQVFELILTSVSLHSELQKSNNECTCKKILFIEKLPSIFKDENSQSRDSEMFLLRGEIRILFCGRIPDIPQLLWRSIPHELRIKVIKTRIKTLSCNPLRIMFRLEFWEDNQWSMICH